MTEVSTRHFLVACKPCGHVWSLTPLPMPVAQVANLAKHSCCPSCESDSKNHVMANETQAVLWAQRQEAQA